MLNVQMSSITELLPLCSCVATGESAPEPLQDQVMRTAQLRKFFGERM